MNQTDIYTEWEELLKEYNAARNALDDALGKVNQKFAVISNPSHDELSMFENAEQEFEDIKRRIDVFLEKHVKSSGSQS